MAQTAPPPSGENIPRPLPRGGRPLRGRDTRPRFSPLDAVWMAALAALFVLLGLTRRGDAFSLTLGAGVIVLTYLLGWRSSGRPAGVISGLLLATSAPFVTAASHAMTMDLFALVTLGALFAFVAGSSLAALALAAAAVWLRGDGLVLGLMLLTFTLIQHRRRAWFGAALFLVPTVAAMLVPYADGGQPLSGVTFGFQSALWTCLATPVMLFTAWFLLPFCGELADPVRRARWLPTVIWTALAAGLATSLAFGHTHEASDAIVPVLPLPFLLAGAGLARLLPVLTGDLPRPALRYAVATLAVVSLIAIRARSEWLPAPSPTPPPSAPAASMPTVPAPTAASVTASPVKPQTFRFRPSTAPVKPKMNPGAQRLPTNIARARPLKSTTPNTVARPKPVIKHPILKPAVPLYMMKNGRMVRRSKWAIQWDLTHPPAH